MNHLLGLKTPRKKWVEKRKKKEIHMTFSAAIVICGGKKCNRHLLLLLL